MDPWPVQDLCVGLRLFAEGHRIPHFLLTFAPIAAHFLGYSIVVSFLFLLLIPLVLFAVVLIAAFVLQVCSKFSTNFHFQNGFLSYHLRMMLSFDTCLDVVPFPKFNLR